MKISGAVMTTTEATIYELTERQERRNSGRYSKSSRRENVSSTKAGKTEIAAREIPKG